VSAVGEFELVQQSCLICGTSGGETVKTFPDGVQVVQCPNCGLLYASPRRQSPEIMLAKQSLETLRNHYAPVAEGRVRYYRRDIFEHYLRRLERLAPGRRLVDVGCAQGFFPALAREHGWDVVAIEPSPPMAAFASEVLGVEVRQGTLDSAGLDGLEADAVSFTDSLEYVPDPVGGLREVHRALAPSGVVLIKVPNADYFELWNRIERLLGRRLGNMDPFSPPERVAHYTSATLTRLVKTAGFDVVHVETAPPIHSPVRGGSAAEAAAPWYVAPHQRFVRWAMYALGRLERALLRRDDFGQAVLLVARKR
jgi:SAM-dependent methyltransferase